MNDFPIFVFRDPAPPYAKNGYRPLFFAKYAVAGHEKARTGDGASCVAIAAFLSDGSGLVQGDKVAIGEVSALGKIAGDEFAGAGAFEVGGRVGQQFIKSVE